MAMDQGRGNGLVFSALAVVEDAEAVIRVCGTIHWPKVSGWLLAMLRSGFRLVLSPGTGLDLKVMSVDYVVVIQRQQRAEREERPRILVGLYLLFRAWEVDAAVLLETR